MIQDDQADLPSLLVTKLTARFNTKNAAIVPHSAILIINSYLFPKQYYWTGLYNRRTVCFHRITN